MLIQHKVAKGETFEMIVKKYAIRDMKSLWALPANKKLKSKRKLPSAIQPGDIIWLPDPKAKVYSFTYKGKTQLYSEKEWKEFQAAIIKKLQDKVLKPAKAELVFQNSQYKSMMDMKKEQYIVSWIIEVVAWTDLSDKQKKAAEKAVANFESALSSGDMKAIKSTMSKVETALVAYAKEVNDYVDDVIGGASTAIWATGMTRDASFIIVGSIAVTVAAPAGATLVTMAKVGFVVGSATGATKSIASEVGESLAGNKRSASKIAWNVLRDTFTGGLIGGLGAGAGKLICGAVAPRLASIFTSRPTLVPLVNRLVSTQFSWIDKFAGGALGRIAAQRGTAYAADVASETLVKLILRVGIGGTIGLLKGYMMSDQKNTGSAVKSAMKKTKGNETLEQFAEKMVPEMKTDKLYEKLLKELVVKHAAKFRKEMEALEKKAAK